MVYELSIARLEGARRRVESYIDRNLLQWMEEVCVPVVRSQGYQKGLSAQAVDLIHAEKDSFLKGAIRWGLKTEDGAPLDLFLEEGTDEHEIEAKFGKALKFANSQGINVYRKKIRHPGTTALNIFKDSTVSVEQNIKKKIEQETTRFLNETRMK